MVLVHHTEEPMRDHTVTLLRELEHAADTFHTTDRGPLTKAIAEHRDAMAAEAARTARTANAVIQDAHGIMLLFDVLVGITTGALAHRQDYWHQDIQPRNGYPVTDKCGTYRCVAGWLVHAVHPNAQPIIDQVIGGTELESRRASYFRLPDGTELAYEEVAAGILGVAVEVTTHNCAHIRCHEIESPLTPLFSSGRTLPELWEWAGKFTGGAITPPADLVPMIDGPAVGSRAGHR